MSNVLDKQWHSIKTNKKVPLQELLAQLFFTIFTNKTEYIHNEQTG